MVMEENEGKKKVCKYCKSEIPVKAKLCPFCRKKQKGIGKWIVIAVIVMVVIGAAAGGGSDKEEPKKVGEVSSLADDGKKDGGGQDSGQKENDQKESDEKKIFHTGDVVEVENLRISFIAASDYVSDNQFMQPKEGYQYIQAEFEFENIGKKDEYVSEFDFSCYADGYDMERKYFDGISLSATLSPGKKTKGIVFYEVPADAKEIELEYEANMWTEKKVVFCVEISK